METLSQLLVFVRSILYPVIGFLLLVMAYSANNRHNAKAFSVHLLTSVLFFILGLMTIVRITIDSTQTINNIGNYAITPVLVALGITLVRMALAEEQKYIQDTKKGNTNEYRPEPN